MFGPTSLKMMSEVYIKLVGVIKNESIFARDRKLKKLFS